MVGLLWYASAYRQIGLLRARNSSSTLLNAPFFVTKKSPLFS